MLLKVQLLLFTSAALVCARNPKYKELVKACRNAGLEAIDKKTRECLTGWKKSSDAVKGCCEKCKCPPGFEKEQGSDTCTAECTPCRWEAPIFEFSNKDTEKCMPCIPCTIINRETLVNCTTTQNAQCGECKPGHFPVEDASKKNSPCIKYGTNREKIPMSSASPTLEEKPNAIKREENLANQSTKQVNQKGFLASVIGISLVCIASILYIICDKIRKRWRRKPIYQMDVEAMELENRTNAIRDPTMEFGEEGSVELMANRSHLPNYSREETSPLTEECSDAGPDQFIGSRHERRSGSDWGSADYSSQSDGEDRTDYTSEEDSVEQAKCTGSANRKPFVRSTSLPARQDSDPESLQTRFESVKSLYEADKLNCMNNEQLLIVAKAKAGQRVINDTPQEVLDKLCHFLDSGEANRNPTILKGRLHFAIRLGLEPELAATFVNSNELLIHLRGKRVPLYKMLEALFHIERSDALFGVTKVMFSCNSW